MRESINKICPRSLKAITVSAASVITAAAFLASAAFTPIPALADEAGDDGRIQIVTTVFPEYDWVMNVLGDEADRADVTLLLDDGTDMHSYQPSAEDILTIATSDVFVYVGGESDEWVDDVLKEADNGDMAVVDLMDILGDDAMEEELLEGMQEEAEDGTAKAAEDMSDTDGNSSGDAAEASGDTAETEADTADGAAEVEYDEHVWLSLRNSEVFVQAIAEALAEKDPDAADTYMENASTYIDQLAALDEKYQAAADASEKKTLLFADRYPFAYMAEDYGLTCYAAFAGCSAETEASFETIIFLANKVDELGIRSILVLENSDQKIADVVIQTTKKGDQQVLVMDSMQSKTREDIEDGVTYLNVMESNLKTLQEALV